jgi:hypothetical protein
MVCGVANGLARRLANAKSNLSLSKTRYEVEQYLTMEIGIDFPVVADSSTASQRTGVDNDS